MPLSSFPARPERSAPAPAVLAVSVPTAISCGSAWAAAVRATAAAERRSDDENERMVIGLLGWERLAAVGGRAQRPQLPLTIIGWNANTSRDVGSTVTRTQWTFGLPNVSRRV